MKKNQKRDTYTLWENTHTYNPSICGIYLSYWDLYTKYKTDGGQNKYTISFPVVFNYDDLLPPFLGFDEFPNCIFGRFSLTARVTPDGLVWYCCDPSAVIKQQSEIKVPNVTLDDSVPLATWVDTYHLRDYFHQFISEVPDNLITGDIQNVYDKKFIQQNTPGRGCCNLLATYETPPTNYNLFLPIKFLDCFFEHKDIIVRADNMQVTKGYSTAFGFGVKPTYKTALVNYFPSSPWVAASEKFLTYPFPQGSNSNGLEIIANFPMINCKEVDVLFPRYPTDTTYFFNSSLEFCCKIQRKVLPKH
jgi:hypothetical protein